MIHNYDTTSEELKPCPFCGGTPVWHIRGALLEGKRTLIVKCQKCGTEQKTGAIRLSTVWLMHTARDKWNARIKEGGKQ